MQHAISAEQAARNFARSQPSTNPDHLFIKRVNNNTFDVWWNNGWENWARFERQRDGTMKPVGGRQMPVQLFKKFKVIVNNRKQANAAKPGVVTS